MCQAEACNKDGNPGARAALRGRGHMSVQEEPLPEDGGPAESFQHTEHPRSESKAQSNS